MRLPIEFRVSFWFKIRVRTLTLMRFSVCLESVGVMRVSFAIYAASAVVGHVMGTPGYHAIMGLIQAGSVRRKVIGGVIISELLFPCIR